MAGARHGALFQRFIVALTRGGPGGLPRPIEMHAHDPRRYVADMLAWVHQVGTIRVVLRQSVQGFVGFVAAWVMWLTCWPGCTKVMGVLCGCL